jgi:hypothetical protein
LRILCPTDYSLSGIGAIIYHKNVLGKVTIALSLLFSMLTLFLWRLLTKRKWTTIVIALNILTVLVFSIDNLISDVSILYGTLTLLFFLIVQLITEIQTSRKTRVTET